MNTEEGLKSLILCDPNHFLEPELNPLKVLCETIRLGSGFFLGIWQRIKANSSSDKENVLRFDFLKI